MDIEIKIKDIESCGIILKHVLKVFPEVDESIQNVEVSHSYGDFTVRISDKVEAKKPEEL